MYDNTVTAREYIGYIAESASCFAFIGRDGKLYFRNLYQDEVEMSVDVFAEYKWGEEFKISKVSYEDGTRSFKFGDETGNNLWINQDNVFIVDEEQIENIYNNIKGLTINSFEGSSIIDPATDIGDKIIIDGKPIVYQGEMILEGKFVAQFDSKIQIKQKEETTVKKESQKSINRKVKSEIDQIEGKITQLVQEQSETETKLNQVEMTVEGTKETIKSVETKANNAQSTANTANANAQNAQEKANANTIKVTEIEKNVDGISQRVEHMADVTNTASGTKTLTLENCVAGPLLELHIYGNNSVFKHMYVSDDLYPSDDLIIYGDSRIEVSGFNGISEESTYDDVYDLGVTEVLRQNEEVCDEYILKDGQAKVIRRVAEDGTTLAEELVEELGEYSIHLGDGTNVIEILNYTANMEAKFAIKNDYTDIFATKVETEAKFELQSERIDIELNKKVDDDKIIAGINLSTEKAEDGSQLKLKADKISLKGKTLDLGEDMAIVSKKFNVDKDGKMECSDAKINGGNVTINDDSTSYGASQFKINGSDTKGYMSSQALELYKNDLSRGVALAVDGIQGGNQIYAYSENGSVGIMFGEIWADGNIYGANISSDKRLKENIKESNIDAIDIVKKMKIKSFDWKDTKKHIDAGFIAQEMEQVDANFVLKKPILDKDGQTIDYKYYMNELPIVATLTKAFQKQQELIEQLQKEIQELKEGK